MMVEGHTKTKCSQSQDDGTQKKGIVESTPIQLPSTPSTLGHATQSGKGNIRGGPHVRPYGQSGDGPNISLGTGVSPIQNSFMGNRSQNLDFQKHDPRHNT